MLLGTNHLQRILNVLQEEPVESQLIDSNGIGVASVLSSHLVDICIVRTEISGMAAVVKHGPGFP